MGTGRDDFSTDTIRRAAERVGYRCSYPDCRNATVGASMESARKVSNIGVAAHICAAAKGGPRYDESMTPEERKGIDNCIWLCQTHAKLIDTDERTYTAELLHKWKDDAERDAAKALANGDYLAEYYKSNGDNLDVLEQLFNGMIRDGKYEQLNTLLCQYKTSLSERYEEFVLRYRIIYEAYCFRKKLPEDLKSYCNLPCHEGVNSLVELFLSLQMIDELKTVVVYCDAEDLKEYATLAISNKLIEKLFIPLDSSKTALIQTEFNDVLLKYTTNFIFTNKIIGAVDSSGNKISLYNEEFYYKVISTVFNLTYAEFYEGTNFSSIVTSQNFAFIRDSIDSIKCLDSLLQEPIWEQLLLFLTRDYELFHFYYLQCPALLKNANSIRRASYICQINTDLYGIDKKALLQFSEESTDYSVLLMYLGQIEKDAAICFLNDHGYLFEKDSAFIKLRINLDNTLCDLPNFLEKYKEIYASDFSFHCILAQFACTVEEKNNEIEWLKKNRAGLKISNVLDYVRILKDNYRWEDLVDLLDFNLPNDCLFYVAGYLTESKDNKFIKISKKIYEELLSKGWKRQGLYFNLGIIQQYLGHIEEAKIYFQSEYDCFKTSDALLNLIQLRYETKDYHTDEYVEDLKAQINAQTQNLIGAIYLKNRDYVEAKKYFLRSLLINGKNNLSINGLFHTIPYLTQTTPSVVGADTIVILESNESKLQIAIHPAALLIGIPSPSTFADCTHYSVEDPHISNLLFCRCGDVVPYNEGNYTVNSISSVDNIVLAFVSKSIFWDERTLKFNSSSAEEMVEQITPILKSSFEDMNSRILEYNQQEIRFPLTVLSGIIGKGMLVACKFLMFGNDASIRNNLSTVQSLKAQKIFVLSYDAIVALAHMETDSSTLKNLHIICSQQVKNQLLSDIDEELASLSDDRKQASMYYADGKISFIEQTPIAKRNRYAFLVQLKSFVNQIPTADQAFDFSSNTEALKDELDTLFVAQRMYCEGGTLGVVRNTPNAVLVTDDQFLYAIANTEKIENVGLIGLLSNLLTGWDALLNASKKLKLINFTNYLPISLYRQMVDQLLASDSDITVASIEIQKWLISDTDDRPTEKHENIIIALFREVYSQHLEYLNPDNILGKLAVGAWERRNPGFIQAFISNTLGEIGEIVIE